MLVVCAVISSTCGQLVSYPLSLVRTRLQAHGVCLNPYFMLSGVLSSAGNMRMHAYLKLNYDETLRGLNNVSGGLVLE